MPQREQHAIARRPGQNPFPLRIVHHQRRDPVPEEHLAPCPCEGKALKTRLPRRGRSPQFRQPRQLRRLMHPHAARDAASVSLCCRYPRTAPALPSHQCVPPTAGPSPSWAAETDSRDGYPTISGAEAVLPREPVGPARGAGLRGPSDVSFLCRARPRGARPHASRRHTPPKVGDVPARRGVELPSPAERPRTKRCDADRPAYCPRRCAWKKPIVLAHASFVAATPAAVCKWANACGIPG